MPVVDATATLQIDVIGDTTGADEVSQALQSAAQAAQDAQQAATSAAQATTTSTTTASQRLAQFGLAWQGVKAHVEIVKTAVNAIAGAFTKLIEVINSLSVAFRKLDRETRRTAVALKGLSPEEQTKHLKALRLEAFKTGEAMSSVSKLFSDLELATGDAELAYKGVIAVMDTAAGTSFEQAQILEALQGAREGEIMMLAKLTGKSKEYLEQIKDIPSGANKMAWAFAELEAVHGGMRLEVDKGLTAWANMGKAVDEAWEEVGKAVFTNDRFAGALDAVALAMTGVVQMVGSMTTAFGTLLFGMRDQREEMMSTTDSAKAMVHGFGAVGAAVIEVGAAILKVFLGVKLVLQTVLTAASGVVIGIYKLINNLVAGLIAAIGSVIKLGRHIPGIGEGFKDAGDSVQNMALKLGNMSDQADASFAEMTAGIEETVTSLGNVDSNAEKALATLQNGSIKAIKAIDDLNESLKKTVDLVDEIDERTTGPKLLRDLAKAAERAERPKRKAPPKQKVEDPIATFGEVFSRDKIDEASDAFAMFASRTNELFAGLSTVFPAMGEGLATFTTQVLQATSGVEDRIKTFNNLTAAMADGVADLSFGAALLEQRFSEAFENIGESASQLAGNFVQSFGSMMQSGQSFGDSLLNALSSTILQLAGIFGSFLIEAASGLGALSVLALPLAIAAGVALMALGGFIASALTSGGGSGAVSRGVAPINDVAKDKGPAGGNIYVIGEGIYTAQEIARKQASIKREVAKIQSGATQIRRVA